MKLSFSNIAWGDDQEREILTAMAKKGYTGLEIAPTRLFPENPYKEGEALADYADRILDLYGLEICSMQSIWYGRTENIFQEQECQQLLSYLEECCRFAQYVDGANLVFGCPKNRIRPEDKTDADARSFFEQAAFIAVSYGSVLALEANPPMYGTNFINTTEEAFQFVESIPGLKVNLDLGTILDREESLELVRENLQKVNHVHISEPGLVPVQIRPIHHQLAQLLRESGYTGYVSVEMKKAETTTILSVMEEVAEVFG